MKHIISLFPFLFVSIVLFAEPDYMQQADAVQRGWYDRPYTRYEAESAYLSAYQGTMLEQSDDQRLVQSEASNQVALTLNAEGDYAEWVIDKSGRGMTIRFSLPDSQEGSGLDAEVAIAVDGQPIDTLSLSSYWAWQYTLKNGGNYPDNTPDDSKFARMRFDETHLLLSREVQSGATLRVTLIDGGQLTLDFIELEPVEQPLQYADIKADNKVQYEGNGNDLATFISANGGKTIYLPQGVYSCPERIRITSRGTQIIGAGEWYTQIFFSASSDNASTYSNRGVECDASEVVLQGVYLNTINNKRYYNNNANYQVGKGLMGSWGKKSRVSHVWIEHFECGAWIANYTLGGCSDHVFEYCRFRNNYADGINLCTGAKNNRVIYCSFRNNGDDDMASWSVNQWCEGNEFAYCIAENNWRASSLGFFGGRRQLAHHLLIVDPLECGARVNSDFSGTGFGTADSIVIHDVTIQHAGCKSGTVGSSGDFWGNSQGSFNIGPTSNYAIQNVSIYNIDIVDARHYGLYIRTTNNRQITATTLHNITINHSADYGMYVGAFTGLIEYCGVNYVDCAREHTNYNTSRIVEHCEVNAIENVDAADVLGHVYDMHGQLVATDVMLNHLSGLGDGIYLHVSPNKATKFIVK